MPRVGEKQRRGSGGMRAGQDGGGEARYASRAVPMAGRAAGSRSQTGTLVGSETEVKMARHVEMELALEQAMRERRESSSPQRLSPPRESASKRPVSTPRRQENSPPGNGIAAQQDVVSTARAKSQAEKELQRAEKRNQRLRVHARARSTERRRSPERSSEQRGRASPEKRSVFRRGRSPERTKQQMQPSSGGSAHTSARRSTRRATDASQRASPTAHDVEPENAAPDTTGRRACKHGCGFVGPRNAIVQHEHSCIKAPDRPEDAPMQAPQERPDADGRDGPSGSGDPAAALGRSSSRQASGKGSDIESGPDEDGVLHQKHDGSSSAASRGILEPLCGVITRLGSCRCDLPARCVLGSVRQRHV